MSIESNRQFLPWLIIAIGGTAAMARINQIQDDMRTQQMEIANHQSIMLRQVQINEELRSQIALQIGDALLKQCVHEYRIDGKLARLGTDLLSSPHLDEKIKSSLSDFSLEVSKNQGELRCLNPVPTKKKEKQK